MRSIPIIDGKKLCTGCNRTLPVEQFGKRSTVTGRLQSRCKACEKATSAAWYAANAERRKAAVKAYQKAHPKKRRHTAKDAERSKAWMRAHPEQRKIIRATYRATHPEKVKSCNQAWRDANTERIKDVNAAWYEQNRDVRAAANMAWRTANPGRARSIRQRRGERVALAGPHYTASEWEALKARYEYRCLMCHRQEPAITLVFDHVLPVSKGGINAITNGQPLCRSCNSRKGAKHIDLR